MKYLIGNHKMNLSHAELVKYFKEVKKLAKKSENVVGVCVPYVYLPLANKMLKGSKVLFGAQNMYYENSGAFTGEVSALMLKDYNAKLVIIGHSERRQKFYEDNELINKKVLQALKQNLTPILCIGETKEEREKGTTKRVLKNQIVNGLKDVDKNKLNKILFAYEPVWAIGTGISATSKDAEDIIKYVKDTIKKLYSLENKNNIVVLYGGSLNGKNVNEILNCPSIDGGLIGGASLKVDEFKKLIEFKK